MAIYVAYGGPLAGRIKVSDLNCERSDVTEVGDSFILSGTISKSGGTDENWYCAVVSYSAPAGGVLHGRTRWIPVDGKPFGLQRSGVSRTGSTPPEHNAGIRPCRWNGVHRPRADTGQQKVAVFRRT